MDHDRFGSGAVAASAPRLLSGRIALIAPPLAAGRHGSMELPFPAPAPPGPAFRAGEGAGPGQAPGQDLSLFVPKRSDDFDSTCFNIALTNQLPPVLTVCLTAGGQVHLSPRLSSPQGGYIGSIASLSLL
jgi:hypothetical protein